MSEDPVQIESKAELFLKMAAEYDRVIRVFQPTYEAMLQLSTDLACVAAPGHSRCIDYGTGTGTALPLLARHFEELVAVDPGGAMLDAARARVAQELNGSASRVTFIEGTATSHASALETGGVDAVHCSLVLMFVADQQAKLATLRTLNQSLRPGGVLVLTELVVDAESEEERAVFALWRSIMRHRGADEEIGNKGERQVHSLMQRRTCSEIRELLIEAGFSRVSQVFQSLHTAMFVAVKA